MAQEPDTFTHTELLTVGHWRSNAAHAYVRCGLRASDKLSKKVYNVHWVFPFFLFNFVQNPARQSVASTLYKPVPTSSSCDAIQLNF